MLELSESNRQRLVVREPVVGVVFLHHTREVVHEEERPAVGDARLRPEQRTLQVEVVAIDVVGVLPRVACLRIAVEGDATGDVLHPVGVLLCLDTTAHERQDNGEQSRLDVLFSHCCLHICVSCYYYPVPIGYKLSAKI